MFAKSLIVHEEIQEEVAVIFLSQSEMVYPVHKLVHRERKFWPVTV